MSWRDNVRDWGDRNPKAHPYIQNTNPLVGYVQRGALVSLFGNERRRWHFLANPSAISVQYNVLEGINMMDPANIGESPNIADGFNSIAFSTLLDRTYEVWGGTQPAGVLADILALERLLGPPEELLSEIRTETYSAEGTSHLVGVLARKPIRAIFGGTVTRRDTGTAGRNYSGGAALTFDGFVTSMSVEYTSFSRNMVPTRAAVSISMSSVGNSDMAGAYRPRGGQPGGDEAFGDRTSSGGGRVISDADLEPLTRLGYSEEDARAFLEGKM